MTCYHPEHSLDRLADDIPAVIAAGESFIATADLIGRLIEAFPERWSASACYGRDLTAQRMGRHLAASGVRSGRDAQNRRGYCVAAFGGAR